MINYEVLILLIGLIVFLMTRVELITQPSLPIYRFIRAVEKRVKESSAMQRKSA